MLTVSSKGEEEYKEMFHWSSVKDFPRVNRTMK